MTKFKRCLSAFLAFTMVLGLFSGMGDVFAPKASAAGESHITKTYAELEAAYDNFLYLGIDVYEVDNGELTDGYVKSGDWLEYRMTILSDMYIGQSYPLVVYDNDFFDIRVVSSTTEATSDTYEGNKSTDLLNHDHPSYEEGWSTNVLTSKPCVDLGKYTEGTMGMAASLYEGWDQFKTNWKVVTTARNEAFIMKEDTWFANWYVRVKDDLADGTTGVSQSRYDLYKFVVPYTYDADGNCVITSNKPASAVSGKLGDILTADWSATVPKATACKVGNLRYSNINWFNVDDTVHTFTIGDAPTGGGDEPGVPSGPVAGESHITKTYAELEAAYDNFIYLGIDVYEVDNGMLTDGYVKPGDWLEYRMTILSDMYIGQSYPLVVYDNDFFDIRVVSSTTEATSDTYEGNKSTDLLNHDHPSYEEGWSTNVLTSKPCVDLGKYTEGTMGMAASLYEGWDQFKTNWKVVTTARNEAFIMKEDTWFANWYVRVKDDLADGVTGVSQSRYDLYKFVVPYTYDADGNCVITSNKPASAVSGKLGDILTADWSATVPKATACKVGNLRYSNINWFNVDDTVHTFTIGDAPAGGATEYTATFKVGDEVYGEVVSYKEGAAIAAPATDPTPATGYEFAGWSTDGTAANIVTFPQTMGKADVTYYAVFNEVAKYTLTYIANGEEVATQSYAAGETIVLPATPDNKPGYTFKAWEGYTSGMTMPAADTTFTASWTPDTFEVSYYKDTDGTEFYTKLSATYDAEYILPAAPTKTGYDFDKWVDAQGNAMPTIHKVDGPVSYYATWTAKEYNAIFDANGGAWADGDTSKTVPTKFNEAIVAPTTNPTKEGHKFVEWTPAVGNMTSEGMTFTAVWEAEQIAVYFYDGDKELDCVTGAYGTTVNAITASKTGYTFEGWYYDAELTIPVPQWPITLGTEAVKVYANWTPNEYLIIFHGADENEWISQGKQTFGTAIATPGEDLYSQFVGTGYELTGWQDADGNPMPETVPAVENQKYFAVITAIKYKATFDADGGVFAETNTDTYVYEGIYRSTITVPGNPTKTGYDFNGWDSTPGKMPAKDVTFTAQWEAHVYNVNYYVNGELVHTDPVAFGAIVPEYTYVPEDAGVSFAGWGANDPAGKTMPAEDINVYANTGVNTYTMTFTINGEYYDAIPFAYGEKVTAPAYEIPEGHTFVTWVLPETMPAYNDTVDATLTKNTYKAYFYLDEEETKLYDTVETVYGKTVEYPAPPQVDGYYFDGWDIEDYVMGAGDVKIHANLTQIVVWYEFVDADGNVLEDGEIAWGEIIDEAPTAPDITGYDFVGYELDGELVTFPYTVKSEFDVTFEATYVKQGHKITYYVDGVINGEIESYDFGDAVTIREDLVKEGHTFSGWTVQNAAGEEIAFPATMPEYDINVYGSWTVNKYPVTFNAGLGAFADGSKEMTIDVEYGTVPVAPETPELAGYGFAAWEPTLAPVGIEGATYTAKFSAGDSSYKVVTKTMNTAGEYDVAEETFTVATDSVITLTPDIKAGFTLNDASVLSGTVTADDALVLTVIIDRNKYIFKTVADGVETEVEYYYEEAVMAPETPVKTGWSFVDWDGTVPATMPANDVTLTASFKINQYTITYDTDGGSAVPAFKADYGTAVKAPAAPTKEGYTFAGWDKEVPPTVPAENITITAEWDIESYTIVIDTDGGNEIADITDVYGASITIPADPTKEGHTFAGWSEDIPAVMPDLGENGAVKTITATWTVNTYVATFIYDGKTEPVDTLYGQMPVAPEATKVGHAFVAWVAEDGAEYAADALPVMVVGGATYTAKFEALTYDATFDANGGAWVDGETVKKAPTVFGEAIEIPVVVDAELSPEGNPVREAYIFVGWEPVVDKMTAEGMEFKAVWANDTNYCRVKEVVRVTENVYAPAMATYTIKVEGSPVKVQIVHNVENGITWTLDRGENDGSDWVAAGEGGLNKIEAYNAAGEVVAVGSADTAYEIWTVVTMLCEGNYKVRAKIDASTWEELAFAYDYTMTYDKEPSVPVEEQKLISATAAVTTIKRGETSTITVVTAADVNRVRMKMTVGEKTTTVSYSTTASAVTITENADGTLTWAISIRFTYASDADFEEQTWKFLYRSATDTKWIETDKEVTVKVTKYDTAEIPAEGYDPFTIISVDAPETAVKGQLTTVVVKTTADVTRVRFNDGGRTVTYSTSSKNLELVDNKDGTFTWNISYRFSALGEQTWKVQVRGNAWSALDDNAAFTITVA